MYTLTKALVDYVNKHTVQVSSLQDEDKDRFNKMFRRTGGNSIPRVPCFILPNIQCVYSTENLVTNVQADVNIPRILTTFPRELFKTGFADNTVVFADEDDKIIRIMELYPSETVIIQPMYDHGDLVGAKFSKIDMFHQHTSVHANLLQMYEFITEDKEIDKDNFGCNSLEYLDSFDRASIINYLIMDNDMERFLSDGALKVMYLDLTAQVRSMYNDLKRTLEKNDREIKKAKYYIMDSDEEYGSDDEKNHDRGHLIIGHRII